MSDETKDEQNSPEIQKAERQPGESFEQYLMRLSRDGHPSGRRVKLSNVDPITIISTSSSKKTKEPFLEGRHHTRIPASSAQRHSGTPGRARCNSRFTCGLSSNIVSGGGGGGYPFRDHAEVA
jgi:hypothetical protein